jgi:putative transcriptional regulator
LVVEHAERGAFGVIVNYPSDRHERISQPRSIKPRRPKEPKLYSGGPLTGPLIAVHSDELFSEIEVLPGVFFAERERNVVAVMRSRAQPRKVFTGYVAWQPGQLERELESGIWCDIPATAATIFSNDDNLWEKLLRQAFDSLLQGMCHSKHIPSDASLN